MAAAGRDIGGLAAFVATREPGQRHSGLFWAACRAAQDHLDPAPLVAAAEVTGLDRAEAELTVSSAAEVIAQARRSHRAVHPRQHRQQDGRP
jgi:hypothetical protein